MLKKLSHRRQDAEASSCCTGGAPDEYEFAPGKAEIRIREAAFPVPFDEGLEYSAPARGTWNIVHTGMMIPESHQIFVCAKGCLRGVVLTAAEMDAMERYSAVEIREENVLSHGIEELMMDGVADVLEKIPYRPKAILLFINCQHFFLAYDQNYVYDSLKERFRDIDFVDCYMIPTLRKSGITPDEKMRMQMYELLKPQEKDPKQISLIGSNLRLDESCELYEQIRQAGYRLIQIQDCKTYEEYQEMAKSSLNLYIEPMVGRAADRLQSRLGQQKQYLPCSFSFEKIDQNRELLAAYMGVPAPDARPLREAAGQALREAKELIGDTPIAVDYTFTFLILSFSRLLLEHGFAVKEIFADAFLPEEKEDFLWIREHYPEILISATKRPERRVLSRERSEEYLAIGQKAAYFTGTDHFVNIAECGGYMGYGGIVEIARHMKEAFLEKKDRRTLVQKKGYGCVSLV